MAEFLDPNPVSPNAGESDLSQPDQLVSPPTESMVVPEPTGWTDALTGAEGPKYWDRLITGEQARLRRHRRSVTIVLLDLLGCEAQAARIGGEAALQSFARLSRTLVSQVRSSDHVTRVGRTRFALLLVETDELQALNFIDRLLGRVRDAIEREGCDVRVGVGWASPAPADRLANAIALAEERLATDFFHTL